MSTPRRSEQGASSVVAMVALALMVTLLGPFVVGTSQAYFITAQAQSGADAGALAGAGIYAIKLSASNSGPTLQAALDAYSVRTRDVIAAVDVSPVVDQVLSDNDCTATAVPVAAVMSQKSVALPESPDTTMSPIDVYVWSSRAATILPGTAFARQTAAKSVSTAQAYMASYSISTSGGVVTFKAVWKVRLVADVAP